MVARNQEYVTWIAELFPPQGEWTEDDYFRLPESNRFIELSDGVLIMTAAASPRHQRIVFSMASALDSFAAETGAGQMFHAPVAVRLWKGKIREPDICFVRAENLHRVTETRIEGPPDWICEVISKRTRELDEVKKLAEYEQAGVPEYWLLDPQAPSIRVYVLPEGEQMYRLAATYGSGEVARSVTLEGFEVTVDEIASPES